MTPLTVIHLTFSKNRSGGTRQALLLARGLEQRGHRVVFCAPEGSPALRWARESSLEARALSAAGLWQTWKASRALRSLAREVCADVVHTHHTPAHNAALLASLGGGFPPVVANRGVIFPPRFAAKFRSSRTAAIIANSRRARETLEVAHVPGKKVHVVYNAKEVPDLEALRAREGVLRVELGLTQRSPIVGAVGGGRLEKGFQFLVEAAPAILRRYPEAAFALVGGSTERFRPRLRELGVEEHFVLPGHRSDAVDLMGLFDVFVFPSVGMDSCPNVVLEAMGVGLPVVGSDVGGVAELLEHECTGILVPPGDPGALAAATLDMLGDPQRARAMGERARRAVLDRFSLAAKVRATEDVYRTLLG